MKRLRYTGEATGHLPVPGFGVLDVHPGLRVTPESDAHQAALLATGHFQAPDEPTPAPDKEKKTA